MTQFYSDETRADGLPDCEVFYHDGEYEEGDCFSPEYNDGEALPAGWYYWPCYPGCLPDGDPVGPFDTEEGAIEDARGA
jgi:hypothetical protein